MILSPITGNELRDTNCFKYNKNSKSFQSIRVSGIFLKVTVNIFLFLILLFSTSCSEKPQISNSKFKITDDAGIEVVLDSLPGRIISLAPNITETLFCIGADSLVVGVTDFCDFPPEAKNKTKTGSYLSPNYEVMTSLNPDLIIINVENISNPIYQALKNMRIKIYVSNAKDLNGIYKMISDFGKITGKNVNADSLNKNLRRINDGYRRKDSSRLSALVLISVNPLMTTNGKTFINDIINLTPLKNTYWDQTLEYPNINYEDVIKKNPEFIIFPTDTNDLAKTQKFTDEIHRQLKTTEAVKNNRIILIDENIMFRPGPRIFDAVKIMNEKIRSVD